MELSIIEENTEGTKRGAEYLPENHMEGDEKTFIRKELLAIHKKYFWTVREKIMMEGIAEPVEGASVTLTFPAKSTKSSSIQH